MKVLLTHGYFMEEDPKERIIRRPYPPLGILSISSHLSKNNIENEVFDSTFSTSEKQWEFILTQQPKYIAIYTNLMTKINVIALVKRLKEDARTKNLKVIIGGPDVTYNVENYLNSGVDVAVIGEGEQTLLELISTMEIPLNPFLDHINGIAYINAQGELRKTDERQKIKEIDTLPWPARNKIDIGLYLDTWKKYHGQSALNVSTQRGCPYTCKWCSTAVYGQSYRRRDPADVVAELKKINEDYAPDSIWFVDDVFTVSHKWLQAFTEQVELNSMPLAYECITRADRMNEEVIDLLRRSGCKRVWIGAESGSQDIIDAMDRRVNVEHVREMIIKSKEAGIETGTFIMLGYPGEGLKEIKATLQHLKRCLPDILTLTVAYPIKGTALYNEIEPKIFSKPNWENSTDREIEFRRKHSKKFYEYGVRYVHNELNYFKLAVGGKRFSLKAARHKAKSVFARIGMWTQMKFKKPYKDG